MSLPYLPVMDLVAQHAANLFRERIDGVMLSWTMGGYPSPNLKVFQSFSRQPGTNIDDVLNGIARERYGEQATEHARKAWSAFSQAFQEYPYHVSVLYSGPQHMGPANLLYWKPTGYKATMVGIPYDDLKRWCGPYPADVFIGQFNRVAIVRREIELARRLYDLALPDARIGFEASCHYFYVPLDLVEKVVNCAYLEQTLAPRRR